PREGSGRGGAILKTVVPAQPGTHRAPSHGLWNMGPRFRGDDSRGWAKTAAMPKMVPAEGFEPPATRLRSGCSTAELRRLQAGACSKLRACGKEAVTGAVVIVAAVRT